MKVVLVTGDRLWTDREVVARALDRARIAGASVLVEGEARGADRISAAEATRAGGWEIRRHPALWEQEGRSAGPKRNLRMLELEHPDTVIAFHDDLEASRGTRHMCIAAYRDDGVKRIYHFSHRTGWRTLKEDVCQCDDHDGTCDRKHWATR